MALNEKIPGRAVITEDVDIVAEYDPELRFRKVSGFTFRLVFGMTLILSLFHIYTAGFGVLQEWRHRAFHLAFVLPLVFLLYSIRRPKTISRKHLVYDLVYALIGTMTLAAIFREIFELSAGSVVLISAASFLLILYFKRREFLDGRMAAWLDLPIFSAMILGVGYLIRFGLNHLHLKQAFTDVNADLVFWSIFLFGTFAAIILLFALQWVYAVRSLAKRGEMSYLQENIPYFDVFFALMSALVSVYIFLEFSSLVHRSGLPLKIDLVVGGFAILLVLEGARRSIGAPLPLISFIVLLNCYLGPYFLNIPGLGFFAHRGYSISRIIEHMYLGTEGIYGIPLGVVATFVFHFVLFGIFISKTGLGQLFMDFAMALAGWSAGGPAKVSVISSGFLGSISGSSIANTVTTGAFTIPLMKRVGYKPQFAGAVEAAASTGGQLMPPIMGAAAFVMAEFLGIPYIKIAACAIIPSFLHFFAVGIMVHFEAKKQGLKGIPREELPRIGAVIRKDWLLLLPLLVIIYLLISGSSPFLAAFWSIIYAVAIGQIHRKTYPHMITLMLTVPCVLLWTNPLAGFSIWMVLWVTFLIGGFLLTRSSTDTRSWFLGFVPAGLLVILLLSGIDPFLSAIWGLLAIIGVGVFYDESRMKIPDIMNTLEWGTKNALAIGGACACVGFIVGATTLTGLGLKFAAAVIELAKGVAVFVTTIDFMHLLTLSDATLFFTLVFTAVSCFILGMGLPTTAQYIIAAMVAAPALLQWNIHPLLSHMFVLFYAVLADVTPPVALAAYAASGISGADPFRTGFTAFALSSAKVYVPFAFIYSPVILWMPHILDSSVPFNYFEFVMVFATILMGVISLAATIIGYVRDKSTFPERIATGIAAGCLLFHETTTSLVGILIMIGVYLVQWARSKKRGIGPDGARALAME